MNNAVRQIWYREPWVWFNLGLLTIASVSAVVMSVVAINHTPAELDEHWYKEGVLIKQQKQQENLVKHVQLQGSITVSPDLKVKLILSHNGMVVNDSDRKKLNPDQLKLFIEHPVKPASDQTVIMKKIHENYYEGRLDSAIQGKRQIMLLSTDDAWHLSGAGYFVSNQAIAIKSSDE